MDLNPSHQSTAVRAGASRVTWTAGDAPVRVAWPPVPWCAMTLGLVAALLLLAGIVGLNRGHCLTLHQFSPALTGTDPLNHTTTFGYDAKGNLTTIKNAQGQPLAIKDPPRAKPCGSPTGCD